MNWTGCKDCKSRQPGCHTECEKYKKFRSERDEYLERQYRDGIAKWYCTKKDVKEFNKRSKKR